MPVDTSYCCCLLFKTFQNFTDIEYSDPNIFFWMRIRILGLMICGSATPFLSKVNQCLIVQFSTHKLLLSVLFRVGELSTETANQKTELAAMKEKLNWEESQRRKLHNMVQVSNNLDPSVLFEFIRSEKKCGSG